MFGFLIVEVLLHVMNELFSLTFFRRRKFGSENNVYFILTD